MVVVVVLVAVVPVAVDWRIVVMVLWWNMNCFFGFLIAFADD